MTRLLVILIFGSMFAVSTAAAQQIFNGIWVVNSERLSCDAACRDRYPLSPGRNAAGQRYSVCAARVAFARHGLRETNPACGRGTMPGRPQHLQDTRRRRLYSRRGFLLLLRARAAARSKVSAAADEVRCAVRLRAR